MMTIRLCTRRFLIALFLVLVVQGMACAQSNWDKVLDRYEQICAQCSALRENMEKGESVSTKSITSLLQELSSLRATLSDASGSMTTAQKNRFNQIKNKYLSAQRTEQSQSLKEAVSKTAKPSRKTDTSKESKPEISEELHVEAIERPAILIERLDSLIIAPVLQFEDNVSLSQKLTVAEAIAVKTSEKAFHAGIAGIFEVGKPNSYGAMLYLTGKHIGGYVMGTSSFSSVTEGYACTSDGEIIGGGSFWGNGDSKSSVLAIAVGPMFSFNHGFRAFAGIGYGNRATYWEDISGQFAKVEDISGNGLLFQIGGMKTLGHLVFTTSAQYLPAIGTVTTSVGIGIEF